MNDLLHAFPGQQVNEPVFVFARPYPLAFIPTALVFVFIFSLAIIGQLAFTTGFFAFSTQVQNTGVAVLGLFQLFVLVVFLIAIFDFYFDIIVVTNRRLVDIDTEQLFFRRISELGLEDVQDVSSQQKGLFQTIFNFGMVEIQTAGTRPNFMIENVYLPRELAAIILNLAEQAKSDISAENRFPKTQVVGLIENRAMATADQLQAVGAIPGNAAQ